MPANKRPSAKTSKTASKQLRSKTTAKAAKTTAGYALGDTKRGGVAKKGGKKAR